MTTKSWPQVIRHHRAVGRQYRERGKRPSNPLRFLLPTSLLLYGLSLPLPGLRKYRAALSLYLFVRTADDIVDGDLPLPQGWGIKEYCEHTLAVIEENHSHGQAAVSTDVYMAYALGAAQTDIDSRSVLAAIWRAYIPDALRRLDSRCDEQQVRDQAAFANVSFLALLLTMLGSDYAQAEEFGWKCHDLLFRLDGLRDLLDDVQTGVVNLDFRLSYPAIDWDGLHCCTSWEQLLSQPDVRHCYDELLAGVEEAAQLLIPELQAMARSTVPSPFVCWLVRQHFGRVESRIVHCRETISLAGKAAAVRTPLYMQPIAR